MSVKHPKFSDTIPLAFIALEIVRTWNECRKYHCKQNELGAENEETLISHMCETEKVGLRQVENIMIIST